MHGIGEQGAVVLMQTSASVDLSDSPTEIVERPVGKPPLRGDVAVWYNRLQLELVRIRKSTQIGAYTTQLLYVLRQLMLDGVLDMDAATSLEALLITYESEESNEHACMSVADAWVSKWKRRLIGFLGADTRERKSAPWAPDWDEIRTRDAEAYDGILREEQEER